MLRLRPYKECDAKTIVSWIKNEFSFRQWCADRYESYPITADDINAHYDAFAHSDSFFAMTAFNESGIVGHLIMRFTDKDKKILRFGFIIVDNKKRGQGLGKEMISLSLKYAFEILKAEKVTLGVFENDPAAYYCYKSAGFKDSKDSNCEYYNVLGESWKCLEMELTISEYTK